MTTFTPQNATKKSAEVDNTNYPGLIAFIDAKEASVDQLYVGDSMAGLSSNVFTDVLGNTVTQEPEAPEGTPWSGIGKFYDEVNDQWRMIGASGVPGPESAIITPGASNDWTMGTSRMLTWSHCYVGSAANKVGFKSDSDYFYPGSSHSINGTTSIYRDNGDYSTTFNWVAGGASHKPAAPFIGCIMNTINSGTRVSKKVGANKGQTQHDVQTNATLTGDDWGTPTQLMADFPCVYKTSMVEADDYGAHSMGWARVDDDFSDVKLVQIAQFIARNPHAIPDELAGQGA